MLEILKSRPKLIVPALVMVPGAILSGLFGITGYLVFFFICIPLTYSILKSEISENGLPIVPENKPLNRTKQIVYFVISYTTFASLLVLTSVHYNLAGIYLKLGDQLIGAYVLLILCLFPILYYLHIILPKSLTSTQISIPLFPSGIATAFGYILTFILFSTNFQDYAPYDFLHTITPLFITIVVGALYIVAPILYFRSFTLTFRTERRNVSILSFLGQFFIISLLGLLLFMGIHLFSFSTGLEYPRFM